MKCPNQRHWRRAGKRLRDVLVARELAISLVLVAPRAAHGDCTLDLRLSRISRFAPRRRAENIHNELKTLSCPKTLILDLQNRWGCSCPKVRRHAPQKETLLGTLEEWQPRIQTRRWVRQSGELRCLESQNSGIRARMPISVKPTAVSRVLDSIEARSCPRARRLDSSVPERVLRRHPISTSPTRVPAKCDMTK